MGSRRMKGNKRRSRKQSSGRRRKGKKTRIRKKRRNILI